MEDCLSTKSDRFQRTKANENARAWKSIHDPVIQVNAFCSVVVHTQVSCYAGNASGIRVEVGDIALFAVSGSKVSTVHVLFVMVILFRTK